MYFWMVATKWIYAQEYIFCNGQNVRSCILNHIKNHNLIIIFFIKFFHVDHIILAIMISSSGRFEIVISPIHTFCCIEIRASFPGVGCCLLCETIFERLKWYSFLKISCHLPTRCEEKVNYWIFPSTIFFRIHEWYRYLCR